MSTKKFLSLYFYTFGVILGMFTQLYVNKKFKEFKLLKYYAKVIPFVWIVLTSRLIFIMLSYTLATGSQKQDIQWLMWTVEYIALYIASLTLNLCVILYKKEMRQLINDGVNILSRTCGDGKTLKLLLFKLLAFDHIALIVPIIMLIDEKTLSIEYKVYITLPYLLTLCNFYTTNAFMFVMTLLKFEFERINSDIRQSMVAKSQISFLRNVQSHRKLLSFSMNVIRMFSKVCIANFLFAFTTSLVEVGSVCTI
jgi:hypothetical protein